MISTTSSSSISRGRAVASECGGDPVQTLLNLPPVRIAIVFEIHDRGLKQVGDGAGPDP